MRTILALLLMCSVAVAEEGNKIVLVDPGKVLWQEKTPVLKINVPMRCIDKIEVNDGTLAISMVEGCN